MKTGIVCWCLFSITFASAFPSQPSSDANALEKSRIKEDSHSSDVNYDTEEQESLFFETHNENKEEKKEPVASDAQRAPLDAQDNIFGDVNDDTEEQQDSRSSQMNPHDVAVEQTFALFEINDNSEDQVTIDDNNKDQNNQIVDERYAENEPEITDKFLDGYRPNELSNDFPQDDLNNMDIDAEDSSVEIE